MPKEKPPVKALYLIKKVGERSFWNRVGTAFQNNDGSLNVVIDFLPGVSLQIREPKSDEE